MGNYRIFLLVILLVIQSLATGTAFAANEISKLVLNKNELALQIGEIANLTATAIYESGSSENATIKTDWNSSSPDVASVYAGVVTAKKEGTAVLTATYMGKTVTVNVDVRKKVKSLTIDKNSLDLRLNATEQVAITAYFDDGTTEDVTKKADYTVDNSSIVTVTNGLVKGQRPGSAKIAIKYLNQTLTLDVDVEVVRRIDAENPNVSLFLNSTEKLKIMATYPDGTVADVSDKVEWTSDNEKIADAIKGTVTGYGVGAATLTATYGTKSTTVSVDVDRTLKLELDKQRLSMKKNTAEELKLTATYSNGSTEDITDRAEWTSSDSEFVQVNKGRLNALSIGEAVISAKYGDKTIKALVDVEVPTFIKASKKIVNMQIGTSEKVTLTAFYKDRDEADITSEAEWTSSAEEIADVRDGTITGIDTGAATITALFGTRKAVIQVSVGVLKSLSISQEILDMKKGESKTLQAEAVYTDDTNKDVTSEVIWTSSNLKVATVDGGKVKAVGAGETTLTAQLDNKTVTVPVQVDMANELTASTQYLAFDLNETRLVQLTATDASGNSRYVTNEAEWKTSNSSIVLVSKGVVTPVTRGKATITASFGGKSVKITVEIGVVQTLTASQSHIVAKSGQQVQVRLTATLVDGTVKDVTNEATWKVTSYKLGTVSNGLFTATGSGKTTLIGSFGGKQVSVPVEIDSLKYLKTNVVKLELKEGETATIEAIATYTDGSEVSVTQPALWTSSNIMVADVKDGIVKATGKGSARITVKYSNLKTTIQVTVKN